MKMYFTLALSVFLGLFSLMTEITAAENPAAPVDGNTALARLKEGNARFASSTMSTGKPVAAKRAETAQGQHPFAIVLACADSRTAPEIVFDQTIGDLFVVRNAGNLVDDHTVGSIEYAVEHLGVRLIVVLGHSKCGAVTAALESATAPGHILSLVRDIQPAVKATKGKTGDVLELTVAENARLMADKVRHEAEIGDLAKQVRIVSAVYHIDTGKIEWESE
jgi:carbonic anhydrase